jgi:hypothetical protein
MQRLVTYVLGPDKVIECVLESVGHVAVMFCLEALKRLTKRLSDHKGFPTMALKLGQKQSCFAATHSVCNRLHDSFVNIFTGHGEVIVAVSNY